MARPRDLAPAPRKAILARLRAAWMHQDRPLVGKDAILAWFLAHGFRRRSGAPLNWRLLLELQRRVGDPFLMRWPDGRPWSTHLYLLSWCAAHSRVWGPACQPGWQPAGRTIRARAGRTRTQDSDRSD